MIQLPFQRLISLIAIAIAVVCGSKSVQAGVITESSWEGVARVASADLPSDTPQRPALSQAEQGGMEGVPTSSSGGSHTVALLPSLARLADAAITGHLALVDSPLPDTPFLEGLPKPA